jgi:hypothetical protein
VGKIDIKCSSYPVKSMNGDFVEDVTLLDLIRAILTVGARGRADLFTGGWRGIATKIGAGVMAFPYLYRAYDAMVMDNSFWDLDSSEKSSISYHLGMVFTKLAAEKRLDIRWLAHVDRLKDKGIVKLKPGKKRGDLVGTDPHGEWHVLEAKGRSHINPSASPGTQIVESAKEQAQQIRTINGKSPNTFSACVVNLIRDRRIFIQMHDPEPGDINLSIDETEFFNYYYRPYINLLVRNNAKKVAIGNIMVYTAPIQFFDFEIHVGLLAEVLENLEEVRTVSDRITEAQKSISDRGRNIISLGSDGVVLVAFPENKDTEDISQFNVDEHENTKIYV